MTQKMLITRIQEDTVAWYLDDETGSLFIACLRSDHNLKENLNQLEEAARVLRKDDITVCYILDDLLPFFTDRFGIGGTPAYLLIKNGIVLGTLLGKNTRPALIQFVRELSRRFSPAVFHSRKRGGGNPIGKAVSNKKTKRPG